MTVPILINHHSVQAIRFCGNMRRWSSIAVTLKPGLGRGPRLSLQLERQSGERESVVHASCDTSRDCRGASWICGTRSDRQTASIRQTGFHVLQQQQQLEQETHLRCG